MSLDSSRVWTITTDEDPQVGICVQLEQLDSAGHEWFADGPGGAEVGSLRDVVRAAAGSEAESGWVDAVVAAVGRQLAFGDHGPLLLVMRGSGLWFHASPSRNRGSILRHGLDPSRMVPPGIAGSLTAETAGTFLASDLEGAEVFARMCPEASADIWSVSLHDVWLESAPAGGGGAHWMICPQVIPPAQIALIRPNWRPSGSADGPARGR